MARNQLFLKSKKQWYLLITYIIFLLDLSGCESDNFSDLTEYITKVKMEPKISIQPLPKIIKTEPFEFKLNNQRDPFKAIDQYEILKASNNQSAQNQIKPDVKRPKEELEGFPFESLKPLCLNPTYGGWLKLIMELFIEFKLAIISVRITAKL
jgi:Tfp pilus assembly protein PilP